VATPSMMPRKENAALTEMNPSCRRARRYRSDSIHSNGAKGWVLLVWRIGLFPRPPDFIRFWPFQALPGGPRPGRHIRSRRQPFDRLGCAHQFAAAVGPLLDLDLALGKAFRPDQNLPGNADQVGGGEFGARALVEIVV
jgi:hypothetical protein